MNDQISMRELNDPLAGKQEKKANKGSSRVGAARSTGDDFKGDNWQKRTGVLRIRRTVSLPQWRRKPARTYPQARAPARR